MATHPFNMQVLQFLADHRNVALTKFFLAASLLGDIQGYILLATLIYLIWDKDLAIRLSVLVLLTMLTNSLLKIIIKNPRPFVSDGTYRKRWAVSAENARGLVTEYSTPSGHAMAAASFYPYLSVHLQSRALRFTAIALIVLIGLSRPYLGVHYVEDVLLGWVIGLAIAGTAIRYGDRLAAAWRRLSHLQQGAAVVALSLALSLLTSLLLAGHMEGQTRSYLAYAGLLSGVVIARPLELSNVNFQPRSGTVMAKFLRCILTLVLLLLSLTVFGRASASVGGVAGCLLDYLRYAFVGVVSVFLAPLVFVKLQLAAPAAQR